MYNFFRVVTLIRLYIRWQWNAIARDHKSFLLQMDYATAFCIRNSRQHGLICALKLCVWHTWTKMQTLKKVHTSKNKVQAATASAVQHNMQIDEDLI